jgi:homocysteine S-methyltransferase
MSVTDGGLETALIFREGIDLPHFAAFPLLDSDDGREAIARYFRPFLEIADARGLPFVLDTPTWRANADWGEALGYRAPALADVNSRAVDLARTIADSHREVVIDGVVGPRGDGYVVSDRMSADEAEHYHSAQIRTFATAGVDRVTAVTLTYVEEAIGVVRAAASSGVEVVTSFTVETDGRLPDGTDLGAAILALDAATGSYARFHMVNCAHPRHLDLGIAPEPAARVGGLRVNGSPLSHAELDAAEELHADAPAELADAHAGLRAAFPFVELLGGCCGTDARHVEAIVDRW